MGDAFRHADDGRDGGYDGEEKYHVWKRVKEGDLFVWRNARKIGEVEELS